MWPQGYERQSSNILNIMFRIQCKLYQAFRQSSYYQTQKSLMCNPNTKVDLYNENCNIIADQNIQMCWQIHPSLPVGKTNYKVSYLLDMDSEPWYLVGALPWLLSELAKSKPYPSPLWIYVCRMADIAVYEQCWDTQIPSLWDSPLLLLWCWPSHYHSHIVSSKWVKLNDQPMAL